MPNEYARAIEKYGFYIATPIGTSMLPLLRQRIDTVKLVAPTNIKKHDVVLYVRNDNTFVLHRVMKITKDGYTMCGDNQFILEKGIKRNQIIAVMEGYYKEEEYIPTTDKNYLKYVKRRCASRRFRYLKYLVKKLIKKVFPFLRKK